MAAEMQARVGIRRPDRAKAREERDRFIKVMRVMTTRKAAFKARLESESISHGTIVLEDCTPVPLPNDPAICAHGVYNTELCTECGKERRDVRPD